MEAERADVEAEKSVWADLNRKQQEAGHPRRHGLHTGRHALSLLYFPLESSFKCRRARLGRGHYFNFLLRGGFVRRQELASGPLSLRLCQSALGEPALISIFIETLSKPLRETRSNQWRLGSAWRRRPPPPPALATIVCIHTVCFHSSEEKRAGAAPLSFPASFRSQRAS